MDYRCTSCHTIVDPSQAAPYAANPSHAAGYICAECVGFMGQILAERAKPRHGGAGSAVADVIAGVEQPAALVMAFADSSVRSEFSAKASVLAGPLTKLSALNNPGQPPVLVLWVPPALRGDPLTREVLAHVGEAALSAGASCFIRSGDSGLPHDL